MVGERWASTTESLEERNLRSKRREWASESGRWRGEGEEEAPAREDNERDKATRERGRVQSMLLVLLGVLMGWLEVLEGKGGAKLGDESSRDEGESEGTRGGGGCSRGVQKWGGTSVELC